MKNIILLSRSMLGRTFSDWLEKRGHRAHLYDLKSAFTAMDFMESRPVDLLVVDHHLPVMDKVEILEFMGNRLPRVPIIFMTTGTRTALPGLEKALADRTGLALSTGYGKSSEGPSVSDASSGMGPGEELAAAVT
jgi:CheY-like chemotaxis protein